MVDIIQPIVFGLVQGLGEFLPISSTAHLILLPYFTGWSDPGLAFDVVLHLGTLVAVVTFFWRDWLAIFSSALKKGRQEGFKGLQQEVLYYLAIATIPGVVFGLLLEKKVETFFRSPLSVAFALIVAGGLLFWVDKKYQGGKSIEKIGFKDAVVIGFSQALAIIPGLSRSGMTISAGLYVGLNKVSAARFSFLLSTPIIMGAALLKLPELFEAGIGSSIVIALASSALSGYLAIKYLLKFLEKYGYAVFFWYRLALGLIIIVTYLNS